MKLEMTAKAATGKEDAGKETWMPVKTGSAPPSMKKPTVKAVDVGKKVVQKSLEGEKKVTSQKAGPKTETPKKQAEVAEAKKVGTAATM